MMVGHQTFNPQDLAGIRLAPDLDGCENWSLFALPIQGQPILARRGTHAAMLPLLLQAGAQWAEAHKGGLHAKP
jgi:hypothetical protein